MIYAKSIIINRLTYLKNYDNQFKINISNDYPEHFK